MILLSVTTVRALSALVGLVPLGVGALLVYVGMENLADPENLLLIGLGAVAAATGAYQAFEAIVGKDLPDG